MFKYIAIGITSFIVLVALVVGIMAISYSNQEITLRNLITAKMKDNQNEFDNMWKKITQVSSVSVKDRESLKDIFNSYASARTPSKDNSPLMKWVQESIPNVNTATFANLQNIITASRDSWTARQSELIDYDREHNNIRTLFPSSLFVGGRPAIDITIVTSGKTEKSFKTGKDDDIDLFKK